jgi:hypothetical protein
VAYLGTAQTRCIQHHHHGAMHQLAGRIDQRNAEEVADVVVGKLQNASADADSSSRVLLRDPTLKKD